MPKIQQAFRTKAKTTVKPIKKANKKLDNKIKNAVGDDADWGKVKRALAKNGMKKGLKAIKHTVNSGASFAQVVSKIKRVAKKQMKKKIKKAKRVSKKAKRHTRKPHKKKSANRKMIRNLRNKPWMKEIHTILRRRARWGRKWSRIVAVLRKHGFRLEPTWLKNVNRACRRRRGIFKAITTAPAPQPQKVQQQARAQAAVRATPVYQRRWYLRTRYFMTYYWASRGSWQPVRRVYFLWWSWLVWGYWRWESYPVWYWASYNYWSYE